MKKLFLLFLLVPLYLNAQDHNGAIGIRGGESGGITAQMFKDEGSAIQALLSFRRTGVQFTVLTERYMPVLLNYSDHIFLYEGYGGHIGYERWYKYHAGDWPNYSEHMRTSPLIGIDGIVGLEYRLFKYPFKFGIEYKPFAELSLHHVFRLNLWDFGVTIHYTFNK